MKLLFLAAALGALALPVAAGAADADADAPASTLRTVTVFGNDACPPSSATEIVVCARRPEADRYRIPKNLRQKKPTDADGAWGASALALDEISRRQMIPGSCSPNGSNGQSGCRMQQMHQWYAERKQQKAEAAAEEAAAEAAGAEIEPQR